MGRKIGFPGRSATDMRHLDLGVCKDIYGNLSAELGITILPLAPQRVYDFKQILVTSPSAKGITYIVSFSCKQAGVDLPYRRQSYPRAVSTERLSNRSDEIRFPRHHPHNASALRPRPGSWETAARSASLDLISGDQLTG